MIQFRCECGRLLQAKEELAGRLTRCPTCDREFSIPNAGDKVAPAIASGLGRTTGATPPSDAASSPDYAPADGPSKRSGKALASLILGIASLIFVFFAGIPAIILGIIGLKDVHQSRGRVHGTGMAITGLILGVVGCMLTVPLLLAGLLVPAIQKTREAANRMSCANNLKQLALAMQSYHDANGRLPPAIVRGKDGKPLYSWRVLLLPFLDEDALYKQFKLDEPWDSPNNIQLLTKMPRVFRDPSVSDSAASETVYQVLVGPKTAFENPDGLNMLSFTDGLANTILIVEAAKAVPWSRPDDLPSQPNGPLPGLGGHHVNGFNAVFADGSVHFIPGNTSEPLLRGLITRNGGEKVAPP